MKIQYYINHGITLFCTRFDCSDFNKLGSCTVPSKCSACYYQNKIIKT